MDKAKKGLIDKLVSKYYLITIKYSEPEKTTGPSGCEAFLPLFLNDNVFYNEES